MTQESVNTWTGRLITGLFTAAAAWGSVTVEIRRTVDARAELTEQRLMQRIDDQMGAAMRYMDQRAQRQVDSLLAAISRTEGGRVELVHVPQPVPVASPADTTLHARLDATNDRLRNVALAITQLRNQVAALAEPGDDSRPARSPKPKR